MFSQGNQSTTENAPPSPMKISIRIVLFAAAAIAIALLVDAWHSARHDSQQLAATLATQTASLQHERDAALAVAHGGPFLTRLKRATKWFVIGVATAAVVAVAARH